MEIVSLTASVTQLIDVTAKAIKYLNCLKEASKERANLFQEASSLLPLLVSLQTQINAAQQSEPWFDYTKLLGIENGPLDQLRQALVQLTEKLKPKRGVEKAARALIWTLDKAFCDNILHKIERVKSSVSLALQGDTFKLAQAIKVDTLGIDQRMAEVADGVEAVQLSEHLAERQKILMWFCPLNFFKTQQDVFARRQEGTGQWLIESSKFQAWLSGSERILCCPGVPGAGKTILASVVVDILRTSQRTNSDAVGVTAIYCNFKERGVQTPHNLLAGACVQLIQNSMQPLPDVLMSLYKRHNISNTRPSWEEINRIFLDVARSLHKVYIVVDAIDECSEQVRNVVVSGLKALPDTIRILITTRPIHEITRLFPGSTKLEIRATGFDLTKYITTRIANNPRLARHVQSNTTLEQEICTRVILKADGIFLSAKLHVDSLSSKTSVKALKKALDNLPSALDELYDDALRRIRSQDQDDSKLAEKALRWVAYAYRPLSAPMLQEAVAIDPEETDYDPEAIPAIDLILEVCSGLLIMDVEASVVRLVHYTAQDYFNALAKSEILGFHASIAAECLIYVKFDIFQTSSLSTPKPSALASERYSKQFPYALLLYTLTFWAFHAKAASPGPQSELGIQSRKFLMSDPRMALWTVAEYDVAYCGIDPSDLAGCKGYGIAAFFGLCDDLRDLLPCVDDVDASLFVKIYIGFSLRRRESTALQLAIHNNEAAAVEVLLEHGADIEYGGSIVETPLITAIRGKSVAAAIALVARGANVTVSGRRYEGPVALVGWASPCPFIEHIVNAGGKIYEHDLFAINPLMQYIIDNEDIETARWLFEHATVVSEKKPVPSQALMTAVQDGCIKVVEILIENGADLNLSKTSNGRTCLQIACASTRPNRSDVLKVLMDCGTNINARDELCRTALHAAISDSDEDLALTLLQYGADINHKTLGGKTALHMATYLYHQELALALLQRDADVDIQDNMGLTALHVASITGQSRIADTLLSRRAMVDTKCRYTMAMLYPDSASSVWLHYVTLWILGEHGGDPMKAKLITHRALENPSSHVADEFKDLLRNKDSMLEGRAFPDGMTALDIAVLRNDQDIIRLLEPLSRSNEQTAAPSFGQYLMGVFQVSSMDDVLSELDRLIDARKADMVKLDANDEAPSDRDNWKNLEKSVLRDESQQL
ncbi:MAG: hypothetical protein Q9205_002581 [Flavoplaca limonia]